MIWLIPSGFKSSDLNVKRDRLHVGLLMTPRTWHMNCLDKYDLFWAGDNDCYTGNFKQEVFTRWLREGAMPYRSKCLFVTAPDVVGDYKTTLELFKEWRLTIKSCGYPVALALQDGISADEVDWDSLDAVFLGGSTEWKMGTESIKLLEVAGQKGKWRHIGRVNSLKRMRHFWHFADSFDGTDYVHHPKEAVELYLPIIRWLKHQGKLL